jgi:hypothetical protein
MAIKFLKSSEVKDTITQWDVYFSKFLSASNSERKVTLAELQKIILWNIECDTASLNTPNYQALDRWEKLLYMTKKESAISNLWAVAHEIVKLVIHNRHIHQRSDSSHLKCESKSKLEKNREKNVQAILIGSYDSVSLLAAFNDISIIELNGTELELLSKVPRLVLEMEISHSISDNVDKENNLSDINIDLGNCNDGYRNDCPSTCAMLIKIFDRLCSSITEKSEVMRTKFDSFLARAYNPCLNWLQNYHQDKVLRGKDKKNTIENNLILTGCVLDVILSSSSTSFNSGECVNAVLRAVGNCLNCLSVGSYEKELGVNLCSKLEHCITGLLSKFISNGWNIVSKINVITSGQGILNTCLLLTSLVSSKCLTNKLYYSSSQLVVSCLIAVDSLQRSFKSAHADVLRADCTVDINAISRLLNFVVTTCSLSYLSSIVVDNEKPADIVCMTKV